MGNDSGVGVDIRVGCSVVFGLSETIEGYLQEGGRSMRGANFETEGQTGFSFFLHKGALGMQEEKSHFSVPCLYKYFV